MGKAGVRITAIAEMLDLIVYQNASSRGRSAPADLPIVRVEVSRLPGDLDTIIVTSDLQGMLRFELLGIRVAEHLESLVDPDRTGVILAGDMYCVPTLEKRGGFGPVVDVWRAFDERFAWVCGVAGNHDDMRGVADLSRSHALDGDVVELDGLRIGGVGGIISNKQKAGRRPEHEQLALIDRVLDEGVDILVLHEGPHGDRNQPGNDAIRTTLDATEVPLVICGHAHWQEPLAERANGQILNVDARVLVLQAGTRTAP